MVGDAYSQYLLNFIAKLSNMINWKNRIGILVLVLIVQVSFAQNRGINWTADGLGYIKSKDGGLVRVDPKTDNETPLISREQLTPAGSTTALKVQSFDYSADKTKLLLFPNTEKVWRYNP